MASYCTLDELKDEMQKTDTGDDVLLQEIIDDASGQIDAFCNRPDGFVADQTAGERYYPGNGKAWLRIDEFVDVTEVSVKDSPDDTTYVLWVKDTDYTYCSGAHRFPDFNPTAKGKPYTMLLILPEGEYSTWLSGKYTDDDDDSWSVRTVKVKAKWGYATVCPRPIHRACLIQAARWYKKMQSAGSDTGANANMGQLTYGRILDGDIEQLLVRGRFVRETLG